VKQEWGDSIEIDFCRRHNTAKCRAVGDCERSDRDTRLGPVADGSNDADNVDDLRRVDLFFRAHDAGVILQFLMMISLTVELGRLSQRNSPSLSQNSVVFGIVSILLVVLLLALGTLRLVNDMFYMLPQGLFGAWLALANVRLRSVLPPWLRYFGTVVGVGLILVGTVFPGLATFVYPSMWKIPAVSVDNDTFQDSVVNRIFHLFLYVGSLLGVATLPVWTLITGWKLLANKDLPRQG
jgi:hypothetical protein